MFGGWGGRRAAAAMRWGWMVTEPWYSRLASVTVARWIFDFKSVRFISCQSSGGRVVDRQSNVVDQSRPPNPHGQGEHQVALQSFDGSEGLSVDHLGVLDLGGRFRRQNFPQAPPHLVAPALTRCDEVRRRRQR